jgi:hypothetical protein
MFASGANAVIDSSGFKVSSSTGTVRLTANDGASGHWSRFANGTARTTAYGNDAIVLGGKKNGSEQYVTVNRHTGVHTWTWKLDTGSLQPTLRPDGSVLVSPAHVVGGFSILPVAILDARGKNVTPHSLHWGLQRAHGSWSLTLTLDDARLPVPYVIDPALVMIFYRSNNVGNSGAGATTMVINKPAGLAVGDLMIAGITMGMGGTIRYICAPSATGTWTSFISTTDGTTNLHQEVF